MITNEMIERFLWIAAYLQEKGEPQIKSLSANNAVNAYRGAFAGSLSWNKAK